MAGRVFKETVDLALKQYARRLREGEPQRLTTQDFNSTSEPQKWIQRTQGGERISIPVWQDLWIGNRVQDWEAIRAVDL
jgi:hypothetical protein